jgi:two-component system CheB/CheR fusion protein
MSDNQSPSGSAEQLLIQPEAEHDRAAQPVGLEEPPRLPFPVVGIGASAGGIEAAMAFFEHMRADSGMAFVLVQHLPPDRETLIPEILSRKTKMTVLQVEEGQKVLPNHIYVIRPGRTLTLKDGTFRLGEPLARPMHTRPIDDFLRSLAEEQRECAIAVILSGMGSNGAAGAQAIKAVGGLCVAQDPESAAFPSMPRHLIDAGYADYILKPADMPETLLAYAEHPYARHDSSALEKAMHREAQHVREILAVLRTRTRHDFTGYKKPTLLRRVQRRMGLSRIDKLADYAKLLRQTPNEVISLADDLLIHVTGFFRDPDAWETLRQRVIVPLVQSRESGSTIRCWVAACSSGEEAYTLAMLLVEEAERAGKTLDIKIFATDTAERTLQNARHGVYPGGIESEITPQRLERFFRRDDAVYRISQELRELVVFAPQNVLQDPPFSRLDLVTCRNLLIYLEAEVQHRVLSLLHFGLRDGGTLFLGTSETAGTDELFEPIDKKARLFRRVGPTRHGSVDFPLPRLHGLAPENADSRSSTARAPIAQIATRALLEFHTPAAVAIDRQYRILYYHGDTSPFLQQPSGEPTRDLMTTLRDTVRGAVRSAVQRVLVEGHGAAVENAWTENDGKRAHVAVTVSHVPPKSGGDYLVVSFQLLDEWPAERSPAAPRGPESAESLRRVRDELQSTIEELQTSNEELKAAHEEVVSTNEELQSTNEELETSREEMQSLNEELSTVNSQLQTKMEEYQAVTNDLASLLTSTDIAVLFLDTRFRIRRFTPQVKDLLDVIATDVGRPLSDLARKFDDPHLIDDAVSVLERLLPSEREIAADGGRWFLRRLTPYRTSENRIDGVVVTFVETTARRGAEEALRRSEELFRQAIEKAPIPVILVADNGEVLQLSDAWTELTGYGLEDIPTLEAWLTGVPAREASTLRSRFRALVAGDVKFVELEFSTRTRDGRQRRWTFSASCPGFIPDGRRMCVGMAVDVTERRLAEAALQTSKDAVESASAMKDQFLATISHELRTPLSVILLWSKLLAKTEVSPDEQREAIEAIARSAEVQRRLIEDLLDTTRIASGKLNVVLKPTELRPVLSSAIDAVRPMAAGKHIVLDVNLDAAQDLRVLADAARLEQVVWILLTNAVKFTPKNGTIRLEVEAGMTEVRIVVADSGRGIAPEFLPRIFIPFSQAEEAPGRIRSGLGLGLSIARSLVMLHNGNIVADSGGLDQGATFTVMLPLSSTAVLSNGDAFYFDSSSLRGVDVLLIEDNVDALRAIATALESAGARVTASASPAEAFEMFRKVSPSLVISDLSMPELDGKELIRKIRGVEIDGGRSPVKAIALTAAATGFDRTSALESGFDEFLTKPVDPEHLIATVRDLMDT